MTIDTLFGTQPIAASYNSASGEWLWNFQIRYDGAAFVDPTGADLPHRCDRRWRGDPRLGLGERSTPTRSRPEAASPTTSTRRGGSSTCAGRRSSTRGSSTVRVEVGGVDYLTVEQCTAPRGSALSFFEIELNAAGDPVAVDDTRTGRRVEYEYDAGRLVGALDPLALDAGWDGTRSEYDALFPTLLSAIVNSEGERVEYDYQANRRIVDVVQIGEGNPTHHFEFNSPKSLHRQPLRDDPSRTRSEAGRAISSTPRAGSSKSRRSIPATPRRSRGTACAPRRSPRPTASRPSCRTPTTT